MGHVSDFNGMNDCDEADISQGSNDLISTENILNLQLTEHLLPISSSFTDDIYRQNSLYTPCNPNPLIDDDQNNYFGGSMFDLLFDADAPFNIDFDSTDSILAHESSILENTIPHTLEASVTESNVNINHSSIAHINNSNIEDDLNKQEFQKSSNQINLLNDEHNSENVKIKQEPKDTIVQNSHGIGYKNCEVKSYTAETIVNTEPSDLNGTSIPKLIIKLKQEPKAIEQEFSTGFSPPMTIADNVKLGRRRSVNNKTEDSERHLSKKAVDITHKRKSRHKKEHITVKGIKREVPDVNRKFKSKIWTKKTKVKYGGDNSKTFHSSREQMKNYLNYPLSDNNTSEKSGSSVDIDFDSYTDEPGYILKNNSDGGKESEASVIVETIGSYQYDFEDADMLQMSMISSQNELNGPEDDFLEHLENPLGDENIPHLNKSFIHDMESMNVTGSSKESSFSSLADKEELCSAVRNGNANVTSNKPSKKSSSVSDLIEELNAHHQQVFEEIEISTPELELELCESKTSVQIVYPETSHQMQHNANDNATRQNETVEGHGENDMNSQNHLPMEKSLSAVSNKASSVFNSGSSLNGTARPRNISSSSSSVTSRSSTSHRSYRKRRSRLSSSSSSSEREKFYNRPVKYNPVTDTYCDEFGREIRANELKYYLNSKPIHRDTHSNNGSSSSACSRSKSPRHRNHHRKHKSRSDSRSHKKRRYSSSRSRSRSRGRKRKDDGGRKYRSPSPMHRSRRPHYMDLEENVKANEERRVMYVGDIPPGYTVEELKERFSHFGPILDATIKSKTTSDYSLYIFGFVTFKNRLDACNAIENGNNNPLWPKFDLNFGGRRRFCNGNYTDLDGRVAENESGWYGPQPSYRHQPAKQEDDFAELLRMEQRRLGMAKK